MPELPEVETVKRGLAPALEGASVRALHLHREGLRFPFPPNLALLAAGRRIISVARRAKYLLIELEGGQTLISHLGMSGSWRVEEVRPNAPLPPKLKHDHAVLLLERSAAAEQNGQNFRVSYNDPRRFGFLLAAETAALSSHPLLVNLGIEPLGNALSGAFLQAAFKGKKAPLKTALLNQNIIAGLGNIYVCEALWRARLSPVRAAGSLAASGQKAAAAAADLAQSIRSVLEDALASGGSHLRNYTQTDGSLGYFQHSFQVYGRAGEACRRCGELIENKTIGGRSSFYCGACQK